MADVIELSKSSRAMCRTCRAPVPKDTLRFGEEVPSAYSDRGGTTHLWHHLECAAKKKPAQLRIALVAFDSEVPNRAELERLVAEHEPKQKPIHFPYAERATTSRSHCGGCHQAIEKGRIRVATERDPEPTGMTMGAPRFWHPRCAPDHAEPSFDEKLRANSKGLTDGDFEEIARELVQ